MKVVDPCMRRKSQPIHTRVEHTVLVRNIQIVIAYYFDEFAFLQIQVFVVQRNLDF